MERRSKFEKSALARYYLSLQAKKLKQLEISECGKFDVNIVVSESDRYELGKIALNANISIVPNGVDTNYFIPLREDDSPSLIYTGGMNMFANRDAVLYFVKEIFPKISMRVPNVKFFAVGQDPPPELKRLSDTDKKIVVTGYVNDIRHLVGAATVYVVPLRVGGGTRLKVLDAMAMGKAIVSTSIGCEGLSVNNDVNILVADTPSAFAEKTVELMRNPYRRKSLGEMARKLVEIEYDWSIIGRNLQIIYENAISTKQHLKSANMVGIV
jgi:glycosyltransferase involved in cell wall biosynthesis